jgi:hypothetical protein
MTRDTFKAKGTPPSTHHGFGLPPRDEPSYKIILKQLDNCEETQYEVTKTSTARYLLGETMSRADAITLCDKHCVTISSTPKNSEDKDE